MSKATKEYPWFKTGYWGWATYGRTWQGHLIYFTTMALSILVFYYYLFSYDEEHIFSGLMMSLPLLCLISSIYFYLSVLKGPRISLQNRGKTVSYKTNKSARNFYLYYLLLFVLISSILVFITGQAKIWDYIFLLISAVVYSATFRLKK